MIFFKKDEGSSSSGIELVLGFLSYCYRYEQIYPPPKKNPFEEALVLVAQSCLTLCNPMDCSPPGSFVQEIFQARMLDWVAVSFSRGSSQLRHQTRVSFISGRVFTDWATKEALTPSKSEHYCTWRWGFYRGLCVCMRPCHWCMSDSVIPQTVVHQAPLSKGFTKQEYWSGLPFPTPGDLPTQGSNSGLLRLLHCRQILYHLSHQGSIWKR